MVQDISFGQMESSTLVNSKRTSATERESSSGKTAENTRVAGSEASNPELAIIRTTTAKGRKEFGLTASVRSGSTSD